MSLQYVRYSDDVEVKQPNEDRLMDEAIASSERMRQKVVDKHRHAMRGAHAKGHGAVKGELTIYDNLPVPFAQGLFRQPRTYPVNSVLNCPRRHHARWRIVVSRHGD